MKIAVLNPKSEFSPEHQATLLSLGEVSYLDSRAEQPLEKLLEITKDTEILAVDPDPLGGFEKAKDILSEIMKSLPNIRGVCLSTTDTSWIDLEYCKEKGIPVSNVPGYSKESLAEHNLALLLGLAKRVILTDRRTQQGEYKLDLGFELKGKTLGIIGLGSIGTRLAELAQGIDMKVIANTKTPKSVPGVEMKSLEDLLKESDAIALTLTSNKETEGLLGTEELNKMKKGVIIVNTANRLIVDEAAITSALKSGQVDSYAVEVEDMENTPLKGIENAIMIKGFGWYTKEALENVFGIWVENIEALCKGNPQNVIK